MFEQPLPVKYPAVNNFEADDLSAFLEYVDRRRGHRAREDTANVGMMPSGRGEEDYLLRVCIEDGGDDSYVGQVAGR